MTQKKWTDKIPVTIGVIKDGNPNFKDQVFKIERLFKDVAEACPNSPVYLFSSLDGSERSAAKVLLDLKDNEKYTEKFELIILTSGDGHENLIGSDEEARHLILQAKRTIRLTSGSKNDLSQISKFIEGSSLILFDCTKSLSQLLEDPSLRQAIEKIEEINSDSSKISARSLSQNLFINKPEELDEQQKFILNLFMVLDGLSVHFHRRYANTVIWLFITGLFTVISFGVYTNVWLSKIMLTIAILLIFIAGSIYYYSRMKKDHAKYLYNRILAEALRIQFYWNIAGINNKVSDYILRIHRKEFTWIELVLTSVYGINFNNVSRTEIPIKDLTTYWVKDQADFFKLAINKMNKKLFNYQAISNISFIAALTLLLSIFLLEKAYIVYNLMNWLQVLIGTLLSIFALTRAYIQIKGYSQLINQYELMNTLYSEAEEGIEELSLINLETDKQQRHIKELFFMIGKEALIENGTWYMILKEKEPGIEGI